jgi:hypothetical protein
MEQMKKNINIAIIIIGIIALLLMAYLLFYFKKVEINDYSNETPESIVPLISKEEIKQNYQKEIRSLFSEIELLIASTSIDSLKTMDDLAKIKIKAMEARVPEEYRDLHLSLVMAIDNMKNALDNNDNEFYKEAYTALVSLKSKIP